MSADQIEPTQEQPDQAVSLTPVVAESSAREMVDAEVDLETTDELLARLERDQTPCSEHSFYSPVTALARALYDSGRGVPDDLAAEEIAFSVHAHDRQDPSSWGLYFGPLMSIATSTGETIDSPSLPMITPTVLSRWRRRATETPHPVMRARYADLLWEIPKALDGVKPDAAMARVAIDAYLEAAEASRYEYEVTAIDKTKRALHLATSLNDDSRIVASRDAMLALERKVADDDQPGTWGFCFDAFVEPPNKRIPVSDAVRDGLVSEMEDRLTRLANQPSNEYHPVGAEAAALRLADHYRRRGQHVDVVRVLRTYGQAVKRMDNTAPTLLVAHSLEQLYTQFTTYGLHQDADALNEPLRIAGERSLSEMKQVSASVDVPVDKVEDYMSAMLSGTSTEVLQRMALHFIPRRDKLETQLREIAESAPLSYMMPHSLVNDEGRTIAHIGPLASDLEGQLVVHMSRDMQFSIPWLRESFARAFERKLVSVEALLDFIFASPLFQGKRRPIVEAGLRAYESGDSISAIHILIPQVEQAIRQLATFIRAPLYTQRRGGGLYARVLDDLIRDAAIAEALGDNATMYLRILLTDARGWNVRNDVCHGLAPVTMLGMPVADRVVHAMLMLSLIRLREVEPAD